MPRKKAKAKKIQIGNKLLTYGTQVCDMIDSNDMYAKQDFVGLRRKLEEEGYLFIRGVIPKEMIHKARTAILSQAHIEGSIVTNDKSVLNDARMYRKGSKWAEGYCVDGMTGAETNERDNIDIEAWAEIGPSLACQSVYNGTHIRAFWHNLFGKTATKALVKQTFLRLMGSSGTIQHCDYYYFKRDTHIFSGNDGINAQKAAKQYLTANKLWKPEIYESKEYTNGKRKESECKESEEQPLICSICESVYLESELDNKRRQRLSKAKRSRKGDFGMEGEWHCPKCALAPLSIYTTWMSLSQLSAPKDSILAMAPKTHLLTEWDLPKSNAQLPGDFDWKLKWVIPRSVDYGDIIIFNIKTVHASSLNTSSPRSFRCSFDTRLQLLPTVPISKGKSVRKSKRTKTKVLPSPHPGIKLKSVIDEEDISEGLDSLKL